MYLKVNPCGLRMVGITRTNVSFVSAVKLLDMRSSYFWESCSNTAAFWAAGLFLAWLSQPWTLYSTQSVPWLWPSRKRWGFSPRSSRPAPAGTSSGSQSPHEAWYQSEGSDVYLCFLLVWSCSSWRVALAWFPQTPQAEQPPPPSATEDLEPPRSGLGYRPGTNHTEVLVSDSDWLIHDMFHFFNNIKTMELSRQLSWKQNTWMFSNKMLGQEKTVQKEKFSGLHNKNIPSERCAHSWKWQVGGEVYLPKLGLRLDQ